MDIQSNDLPAFVASSGLWRRGLELDPERDLAAFWLGSHALVLNLSDLLRIDALVPALRWTTGTSGGRPVPVVVSRVYGHCMVARLVAGATQQQEVSYRDGDPFNVTRENLVVHDMHRRHRRRVAAPRLAERAA